MKLILISDTHCQLDKIIPKLKEIGGDILIHSGDATYTGTIQEISEFNYQMKQLPQPFKIFVAGNHDKLFQHNPGLAKSLLDPSIIYLQDESTEINGLKIFGSPWTPSFGNGWVFNANRGKDIAKYWENIPDDTNLLITHGPPHGFGDIVEEGYTDDWGDGDFHYIQKHVGCKDLKNRIENLKNLKVHVCGHLHDGYSQSKNDNGTILINASICNEKYQPVHEPVVIEI